MIMIVENQIFRFTDGRFFDGNWEHSKMEGPGKMSYVFPSSFLPKCDTIQEYRIQQFSFDFQSCQCNIDGRMVDVTKEIIIRIESTAMAFSHGQMVAATMGNGVWESRVEMVYLQIAMD